MKKTLYVVILAFFGWITPSIASVNDDLEKSKKEWIEAFNDSSIKSNDFYIAKGGLLINDEFFSGHEGITKRLKDETSTIKSAHTLELIKNDDKRYIEIGYYALKNSDEPSLYYITAWNNKSGSKWLRELDVIYNKKGNSTKVPSLDFASKKWEKWANRGIASKLVEQLYTEDAVYLNKGQASTGQKAIITRYGYMYPGYSIDLTPKQAIKVQPKIAFEVGYYDAGTVYKGHYVLVWKEQSDKSWKSNFDFNF